MKFIDEKHEAWETFQITAIYIVDIMDNVAEYEDLDNNTPHRAPRPETNHPILDPRIHQIIQWINCLRQSIQIASKYGKAP